MSKHIIIDRDGNPWGPFETAGEAAGWVMKQWPGMSQDQDHPGIKQQARGWDVVALREPD